MWNRSLHWTILGTGYSGNSADSYSRQKTGLGPVFFLVRYHSLGGFRLSILPAAVFILLTGSARTRVVPSRFLLYVNDLGALVVLNDGLKLVLIKYVEPLF